MRFPLIRKLRGASWTGILRTTVRNWSRNHACAGSVVSCGCHAMKYVKPLISFGGSTTRTSAIAAAIFPNLRGRVRTRSVRAIVKIVGTKKGTRSTAYQTDEIFLIEHFGL